jgi:serine/threonine protein kinase
MGADVTRDQWKQVNALFHEVLSLPTSERSTHLERVGAEEDVRREVAALISAHERDREFLEEPALAAGLATAADSRKPAPSLIGQTIGAYRITSELGRGGMGVVYLARDERLRRNVAIKVLARDLPSEEERERLRREARAAAALAHPGIAMVYALEERGSELYLVSEYVAGRTLRDEIARGPFPVDVGLRIGLELARAVAAAHDLGIVHRDLKPENVIRTASGAVKILDFGLARTMAPGIGDLATTLTTTGTLVGTPAYMAPEQIRGAPVDARADVFALGVILYEVTSGRHPFGSGPVGEILHQVLTQHPPSLAAFGMPGDLEAVISRCLEKEPARRYANARELATDLEVISRALDLPLTSGEAGRIGPWSGKTRLAPLPVSRSGASASGDTSSGRTETARWWWAFHQAAVALFFGAVIVPAWLAWDSVPDAGVRTVLRLMMLLGVTVGASLRLHLRFLARHDPEALPERKARAGPWIAVSDWGIVLALAAGGLAIVPDRQALGALFIGLAICYTIVFLVVEPTTRKAAFRESGTASWTDSPSKQ